MKLKSEGHQIVNNEDSWNVCESGCFMYISQSFEINMVVKHKKSRNYWQDHFNWASSRVSVPNWIYLVAVGENLHRVFLAWPKKNTFFIREQQFPHYHKTSRFWSSWWFQPMQLRNMHVKLDHVQLEWYKKNQWNHHRCNIWCLVSGLFQPALIIGNSQ